MSKSQKEAGSLLLKDKRADGLLPMVVTEGLTVNVLPNEQHEYLMTTKEVANGYGVSNYAIRTTLMRHGDELTEGKHFIKGCDILLRPLKGIQIQPHQTFWTKRGIVRLGFFIKSERAKLFRDWAEELIIRIDEECCRMAVVQPKQLPTPRRRHNRLTQERLVDILADVCRIDDKELRISITDKLMGGER